MLLSVVSDTDPALGHPIEFICLDLPEPAVCKYCGLRYVQDHHHQDCFLQVFWCACTEFLLNINVFGYNVFRRDHGVTNILLCYNLLNKMFMYHMLLVLGYIVMCIVQTAVCNCETGGAASLNDLFYIPNLQCKLLNPDNTTSHEPGQ